MKEYRLMIEDKDVQPATEAAVKRKIEEVARGWRKQWKEDNIRLEKCEHSPTWASVRENTETRGILF